MRPMMFPISQRWRRIAHIALSTGIVQLAGVVTYVVLARLMIPVEYGTYRQLFLINQMTSAIAFSAIPTALLFFSGRCHDQRERSAVIRRHLWLVAILGTTVAAALALGAEPVAYALGNPALASVVPLFAIYPAAYMLNNLVAPTLVVRDRTALLPLFTTGLALLHSVPVILAGLWSGRLTIIVTTATVAAAVSAVMALAILLAASRDPGRTNIGFRQIYGYAGPLLMAGGISMIGLKLDQVFVSQILGPGVFAVYAVGAFELPIYGLIKSSSTAAVMPEITEAARKADWPAVLGIWRDLQGKSAVLLLPASAGLVVFAEEFITLLFGEGYRGAAPVFAIFALLGPVRAVTFGLILRAMGKSWQDLTAAMIFVLLVAVSLYPAIVLGGLVGAAIAVVGATFVVAALLLIMTARATAGALTVSVLYPRQVLLAYLGLLAGFALVRAGADALQADALAKLILCGSLAAAISFALLYGRRRRVNRTSS
jgi:O-antigen/teichoic acid export membrane protein